MNTSTLKITNIQHIIKKHPTLNILIKKYIKEKNYFWYGCVIGIEYNKLTFARVNKHDDYKTDTFTPIVKIRYASPYDDSKGGIIKWYSNKLP